MICDVTPPQGIGVQAVFATEGSIFLTWQATADDDNLPPSGKAKRFDLRFSTVAIDEIVWSGANPVAGMPPPGPSGTQHSVEVTGLNGCTFYHFALRAEDDRPTLAALPPDYVAQTLCGTCCETYSARAVDGVEGGGGTSLAGPDDREHTGRGSAAGPSSA